MGSVKGLQKSFLVPFNTLIGGICLSVCLSVCNALQWIECATTGRPVFGIVSTTNRPKMVEDDAHG